MGAGGGGKVGGGLGDGDMWAGGGGILHTAASAADVLAAAAAVTSRTLDYCDTSLGPNRVLAAAAEKATSAAAMRTGSVEGDTHTQTHTHTHTHAAEVAAASGYGEISKVPRIVAFYRKYTRALTFPNLSRRRCCVSSRHFSRISPAEKACQPCPPSLLPSHRPLSSPLSCPGLLFCCRHGRRRSLDHHHIQRRYTFSKVPRIVAFYSKYTRALTFEIFFKRLLLPLPPPPPVSRALPPPPVSRALPWSTLRIAAVRGTRAQRWGEGGRGDLGPLRALVVWKEGVGWG